MDGDRKRGARKLIESRYNNLQCIAGLGVFSSTTRVVHDMVTFTVPQWHAGRPFNLWGGESTGDFLVHC
jgi:hypothetical protein